jgi:hypothetical protein
MANSDDERKSPVEPSSPKIPEYLVERLAPRSRDPVVIFGGHLLQLGWRNCRHLRHSSLPF